MSVNQSAQSMVHDDVITHGGICSDPVNRPAHYTQGRYEAIDVIEDAIDSAPYNKAGFLQGQVLKYLLRLWHKQDPEQDAAKAQWYLNRLVEDLANH